MSQSPASPSHTPSAQDVEDLTHLPEFTRLMHQRLYWSVGLSLYVLGLFCLYMGGMAFAPDWMATPVGGGKINVGLVIAALVVINGILTAGIYSWWTNARLEPMKQALIARLKQPL